MLNNHIITTMERELEICLSSVEDIMKRCNTNKRNISETIEMLKTKFPQEILVIEERFGELCKKHGYDPADFSTAKTI